MSSNFKLNGRGVAEVMKSSAMQSLLKEKARTIQQRCGDGYEQDLHIGRNRANAMV